MNEGDIFLATLDPAEGREQQGRRPVLIVSATAFNAATSLPVILPITNGGSFATSVRSAGSQPALAPVSTMRAGSPRSGARTS